MSNWRNALVHSDISIEDAIVLLSGNKVTVRVLLVVDKNNYLQGILNDGDIRRALLKNLPMTTQIKNVMNNNPHVISSPYSRDEVLKKMASLDIMQIPVVSENREVCGLETVHTISKVMRYDNPVFLMAGGFGKRLQPSYSKRLSSLPSSQCSVPSHTLWCSMHLPSLHFHNPPSHSRLGASLLSSHFSASLFLSKHSPVLSHL